MAYKMRNVLTNIIKALKIARKNKELSQAQLAKKLGVPQSHLSKIESGTIDIRLSSLIEIARTLELEPMLISRDKVSIVQAILNAKENENVKSAYSVDELEGDEEGGAEDDFKG